MSLESDLNTLLKTKSPRVYPDVAPAGTALPYVTWQGIGGESVGFVDNTAADKRNTLMQVNVWAATRLQALQMAREIEDAMRASAAFVASPLGEPLSTYEPDVPVYGTLQRFSIWAAR